MFTTRLDTLEQKLSAHKPLIFGCFVLILLGVAFYASALYFVPSSADDLVLGSMAARTHNPFAFFVQDAGSGLHFGFYRPLDMIVRWLVYHLFGFSPTLSQSINLALHVVNALLLYRILLRVRANYVQAFLLAAVFLISPYTYSSETWVSDRQTLFVAFALLIFLWHVFFTERERLSVFLLASLSIFALCSKESGTLLPLMMIAVAFERQMPTPKRTRLAATAVVILAAYFGVRYALFHTFTANYPQSGYLLGSVLYPNSSLLSTPLLLLAYAGNVVTGIVNIFLPVTTYGGAILPIRTLIFRIPLIALTVIPLLAAIGRRLSRIQKYALLIIALNALIYFSAFSFRYLYLAQIGFCIFVMGVELPQISVKRMLVTVCLAGLLFYNTVSVSRIITQTSTDRIYQVQMLRSGNDISGVLADDRVDPNILRQLLNRYGW